MSRPASSAPVLGGFLLVAGVMQFMASVALGQASHEQLRRAAAEGAGVYLVGALGIVAGLVAVWWLRRRPLVAAGLLVAWQAAVLVPLRGRTTGLGLAYHGEFVLHHFTALLAAALCVTIAIAWIKRTRLGPARVLPIALALVGVALAIVAHLWTSRPGHLAAPLPAWSAPAPALLIAAWIAAPLVTWPRIDRARRLVAVAGLLVALPFVVRIVAGLGEGVAGLLGAPVPEPGRMWVMTAVAVGGAGVFVLVRPMLSRGLWLMVMGSSFVATVLLYIVYKKGFGDLESDLGGLAISVFGFVPPYPTYVAAWKSAAVMLGLFGMFCAAYASLVSRHDRGRGIALGLIIVSGIGLTSPQLWLMAGAAGLLFYDVLWAATDPERPAPTIVDAEPLLRAAAARLGLPDPIVLDPAAHALARTKGEIAEQPVEIRARSLDTATWTIEITVGMLGRDRAAIEIVPDSGDRGVRPAHLIARTHRIRGPRHAPERIDDALLDALLPLPGAHVQLWSAGARAVLPLFGADDPSPEALADLVHALVDRGLID